MFKSPDKDIQQFDLFVPKHDHSQYGFSQQHGDSGSFVLDLYGNVTGISFGFFKAYKCRVNQICKPKDVKHKEFMSSGESREDIFSVANSIGLDLEYGTLTDKAKYLEHLLDTDKVISELNTQGIIVEMGFDRDTLGISFSFTLLQLNLLLHFLRENPQYMQELKEDYLLEDMLKIRITSDTRFLKVIYHQVPLPPDPNKITQEEIVRIFPFRTSINAEQARMIVDTLPMKYYTPRDKRNCFHNRCLFYDLKTDNITFTFRYSYNSLKYKIASVDFPYHGDFVCFAEKLLEEARQQKRHVTDQYTVSSVLDDLKKWQEQFLKVILGVYHIKSNF